jgi:hypothetical protein
MPQAVHIGMQLLHRVITIRAGLDPQSSDEPSGRGQRGSGCVLSAKLQSDNDRDVAEDQTDHDVG